MTSYTFFNFLTSYPFFLGIFQLFQDSFINFNSWKISKSYQPKMKILATGNEENGKSKKYHVLFLMITQLERPISHFTFKPPSFSLNGEEKGQGPCWAL